jgi:NAD(P)-dependent dehydrogenase (short-subunit alcohol dehydrogenase family)
VRRFTGRTAYITGGSSGIGLAIARELLQRDARVAIIARNAERLAAAEQELAAIRGPDAVTSALLDVTDRPAADRALPALVARFGGPDLLVNSHGLSMALYFEETTNDELRQLLDANIVGTWNTIQILLPELEKRKGTIATVASIAGFMSLLGYSAYSASKFGVLGLSEGLRNELKPRGVRVCVLCPPDTDTPTFERENIRKPPETKMMSETMPLRSPEYVARAFVKGLQRRRFLIVPGFMGRLSLIVKGVIPEVLFGIIDSDLRKAQRKLAQISENEEVAT